MAYVEGFVAAVPAANKDAYLKHATEAAVIFKDHGATRVVEAWGDAVPEGKVTDFNRAVKAKPGEVIVFSWIEFPSKAVAEEAFQKFMADPRAEGMGARMPFDGQRMIYGGFSPIVDSKGSIKPGYIDGMLLPVPESNKTAYRELANRAQAIFVEHGASRVVEAWGEDVPDGKVTDYKGAVKAEGDENVVYSWVEWPSKQARDDGWQKIMADERMNGGGGLYDGKRMVYGGFAPILDA
ncbi:hypothetical protein BN1110_05572 [bacterium YEK0313]|nr:hypothetical protein BN1110_05572 [bacterium YEK0313]